MKDKSGGGVPVNGGNAPTRDAGDAGEAEAELLLLLDPLSLRSSKEPVANTVPRRGC